MYKAKIEGYRVLRSGFDLLHRSLVDKPVDIFNYIPLAFDEELTGRSGDGENIYEEYERLKAEGVLG